MIAAASKIKGWAPSSSNVISVSSLSHIDASHAMQSSQRSSISPDGLLANDRTAVGVGAGAKIADAFCESPSTMSLAMWLSDCFEPAMNTPRATLTS